MKPRTVLYKPEHTEDGLDISMLTPYGYLENGSTGLMMSGHGNTRNLPLHRLDPRTSRRRSNPRKPWRQVRLNIRPQQALKAKGTNIKTPTQPTPQERALTDQPYTSWCTKCAQRQGRQDYQKPQQSRQLVIQCDFAYIKSNQDNTIVPIFTAIGVQTGMGSAVYVQQS